MGSLTPTSISVNLFNMLCVSRCFVSYVNNSNIVNMGVEHEGLFNFNIDDLLT
jgi:hypothetical protein